MVSIRWTRDIKSLSYIIKSFQKIETFSSWIEYMMELLSKTGGPCNNDDENNFVNDELLSMFHET